ncbi:hypothetical protein ATO6_00250 [Oceanicola sp. 22II-s10i]|uniref:lytic transglycosylase domain-containing protein n=1 Tax=Oceanicola sp. 22II-s10i TaxID=1317116 RepID=UPI000B521453|nr:lytic transglycosylase domain-containing protein [Oceanicola sp. 22II-s10i]OWU85426.1 hypothetical protein ATO6_00250 [Oceanicola sp. 22II-s10i]
MSRLTRRTFVIAALSTPLAACAGRQEKREEKALLAAPLYPNETPALRRLIIKHAEENDVPVQLVQRVIVRESTHRPGARNGPYYGLMQILPATARSMGFRGSPEQLYDADTNLRYAVRYLRGAWLLADGSYDRAVQWYARGYYYEAKRRGMLKEVGLA